MNLTKDEEIFAQFNDEVARKGCITMAGLGFVLFPAFIFLDYFTADQSFEELALIRLLTTVLFAIVFYFFKKKKFLTRPYISGVFILALASLSITAMCMVLGGMQSSYYAGINLVALAGVLILPYGHVRVAKAMAIIIGIYIIGVLAIDGFVITSPREFLNNLYFLFSTAVIGVVASNFTFKMRKESFSRLREISRTTEVLQLELESHDMSIEKLTKEVIEKKQEAQNALELRNRFISLASHELKTPLTSLLLQAEVSKRKLDDKVMDDGQVEKLIYSLETQTLRLNNLVDEMLNISRIESGKFDIVRKRVELSALINGIIQRYFSHDNKVQCLFVLNLKENIVGNWDIFKLEQVVLNLLTNAMRYGNNNKIIISTSTHAEEAVLSVKDHGIGIPAENHQKIFEKFERGVDSIEYGGLGLGLYICKKIVEMHNGRIELTSEVGRGSEFRVYLPL